MCVWVRPSAWPPGDLGKKHLFLPLISAAGWGPVPVNAVTYRNGSRSLPAPHPRARSPPKLNSGLQRDLSFLAPARAPT